MARAWLGRAACLLLAMTVFEAGSVRAADQKQAVYCVRFSADGKKLVSGGANRKVQVWDIQSARELASFEHPGWIQTVDFSPDGRYVLSGVRGLTLRVWDLEAKRMHRQFDHQGWVMCGLFLPDNSTVLSLGGDDQKAGKAGIRLWSLESGAQSRAFSLPRDEDSKMCRLAWGTLSRDGQVLAVGGGPSVTVWDVPRGEVVQTLTGLKGSIWKLALSPDGQRCVAGGLEKDLCVWNVKDAKPLKTITRPSGVRALAFSRDGKLFADGGLNGQVALWDAEKFVKVRDIPAHPFLCESIDFSPDGLLLATGSFDNTVKVWNAKTGQLLRTLDGQAKGPLPPLPVGPAPQPPPTSQPR